MKSDEFWGIVVRKYGLPATRPHSIVHVIATRRNGDTRATFTSPVSSGRPPIWETDDVTKELTRLGGTRTDAIQKMLLLTPKAKQEVTVELQLRLNDAHLQESTMFGAGESDFVTNHRLLCEKIRSPGTTGHNEDRDTTLEKLKDLLKCPKDESERQTKEIASFMLRNDQDKEHRIYLQERNQLV